MSNKVLFFTQVGNGGGAERMTANIASILDRNKYDIKFYAVSRFFKKGICPIPDGIPLVILKNIHITFFSTLRFILLLRQERPDFVFCSLQYINWRLICASKLVGGIKVIVRNENTFAVNRWADKISIRFFYKYADVVIAQQDEMREEIIHETGIDAHKVLTLQNPVDVDKIKEMSKEACPLLENDSNQKYISVGRISKEKGLDVLLKSYAKVKKANPNSSLYILGRYKESDSYFQSLVSYIKENSLRGNVHFVGFEGNPYKWISKCDCFVLSSRLEGLPNVLIEALNIGKPVAATTCIPVIDRIVNDGKNGYKVAVDDVEGLAEAMMKAVELKEIVNTYKPATKEDFISLFK